LFNLKFSIMKTLSGKIWMFQFSDAKNSLWTIPFAHVLMAFVFLGAGIFTARLGLNIFIPVFFGASFYLLDLKDVKSMHVISSLYFVLCLFELVFIGIPEVIIPVAGNISKGAMFEMIFYMMPYVYVGLKFALGIILIRFISILKSEPTM